MDWKQFLTREDLESLCWSTRQNYTLVKLSTETYDVLALCARVLPVKGRVYKNFCCHPARNLNHNLDIYSRIQNYILFDEMQPVDTTSQPASEDAVAEGGHGNLQGAETDTTRVGLEPTEYLPPPCACLSSTLTRIGC
jgi:hypothetical protein